MAEGDIVPFDPRALLAALERSRVNYVVIGAVARILHGTDEVTDGLDICPQGRPENTARLLAALDEVEASGVERREALAESLSSGEIVALGSRSGELRIVPQPAGTRRGWDDLRRHANRESIGDGLRVSVASLDDLVRMAAALDREGDQEIRRQMRLLQGLERGRGLER